MKKVFLMVFALVFVLFIPMALYAQSGWVLYDDFESGSIDNALWDIDNSSADITVENGKAKFTYRSGHPNDSSWLSLKNPGMIEAVKATILVDSSNLGSGRARIGANTAQTSDGYVIWQNIQIYSTYLISYWSGELDTENNWVDISQRSYVEFLKLYTGDILGQEYTLSMTMQPTSELVIGGPEVGQMTYTSPQLDLTEYSDPFIGIGIRSGDSEDAMVVYFDNVYVKYRNNISDKYDKYDKYNKYDKYD